MRDVFTPRNAAYQERVAEIFSKAPFIQTLGVRLVDSGPGWCESMIELKPQHTQQDGFGHAGVVATLADHTAGASAGSLVEKDERVLSVEYKINLLRPAVGERLRCRAEVLRAGRRIIVSESEVFVATGDEEKMCAKATVTLAVV